jgi:hypothetical protein
VNRWMNIEDAATVAERWLADAYGLIESGWCQGAPARDAAGRPIEPESNFAVAWSAPGALLRLWRRSEVDVQLGLFAFQRANLALAATVDEGIGAWNDRPGRRQADVLEAILVALSTVRETELERPPGEATANLLP